MSEKEEGIKMYKLSDKKTDMGEQVESWWKEAEAEVERCHGLASGQSTSSTSPLLASP